MSHSETDDKFQKLLIECDQCIKAGKFASVSALISDLNLAQVPRKYRASFAKVCRRAGLISQGLRLLQPVIRNQKKHEAPPSPSELSEYAVLLSRNGSVHEALELLENVDASVSPEALLYQGFCHISNWDYQKASVFLEKFLISSADNYTKLIARVNLVAAYITVRELHKASDLLNEVAEEAQRLGSSRLIGNTLELRAQICIHEQEYTKAQQILKQAQVIFHQPGSFDQLMILKWMTIAEALKTDDLNALKAFRVEALRRRHWESVRETDLFSCLIEFDAFTFDHLIVGTPMEAYRQRVHELIPKASSEHYIWRADLNSTKPGESEHCLDLEHGNRGSLKVQQTIQALARDFYVPRNMGTLFSELYPDEYFDINSSPLRVRQWIRRTRQWFDKNQLALSIAHADGSYRLYSEANFGLRVSLAKQEVAPNLLRCNELRKVFKSSDMFSAEEACQTLGISRSSFHRLVKWGISEGELCVIGQGRSRKHSLTKKAA